MSDTLPDPIQLKDPNGSTTFKIFPSLSSFEIVVGEPEDETTEKTILWHTKAGEKAIPNANNTWTIPAWADETNYVPVEG
ncbi:MAG: hypothetical protein CMO55_16290 [Verrucomicrobiales bacterium]|nr:hypothetical protein [Verrucomicrobiales bacterium]